jgi:type II secretion system protein D
MPVKASLFGTKRYYRQHSTITMVSPFFMRTASFFFAFLITFNSGELLPLSAQDNGIPTGQLPPPDAATPAAPGNFANFSAATPINAILDEYEQLSGKHLIRDANLVGVQPMSINATGVSKAEMLKLIEANLLLNGIVFVPVDDHTMKVIVSMSKNPGSEGVRLYANADDLPQNDQVVSYYMPLRYLNPQEVVGIFSQMVAQKHTYGSYVAMPTAQAVVITENISMIRQLIALKELMDVPPARVVSEFVQLNRADADTVAALLNKMLNPTPTAGAPAAPGGIALVPPDLGNTAPLSNERNLLSGTAQIVSDPRSNRLLVITRPVNMSFLKELIAQLDQPDIFLTPQRRPLKYVLAQDILTALESALAQGKEEQDQVQKSQSASSNKPPNSPGTSTANTGSPFGGGGSSGGSGSVSAVTPSLTAPQENNIPIVVTVGKTRLMADNNSNSIIVFGSPDVVSRVFAMIDELDRKPLQVYLATVIGELTVSEGTEFGIDILQKFQKVGQGGLATGVVTPGTGGFATSTSSTTTTSRVPEPRSLTSSLGFPLPTGLTLYGAIGSTLDAYVRALQTTNRFKVISRPSVYTTNNKLAVIASGSQIPVPGNITSGFTGGTSNSLTTTANVNYESVLLELQIVPLINANHEVTLQIRQTNNSQGASQIISGNSVPTILTQEINTEVTVPDKSTVVIGGLITDNTKRNTSGVPLLSDIPVLGYLFKDTSKSKERDELIIMIQPTVVETDADQIAANETEKQRTILGREAEDAASYTLPKTNPKVPVHPPASGDIGVQVPSHETQPIVTVKSVPKVTSAKSTKAKSKVVPTASSPAPDVSNGQMPNNNTPPPSTTP